MRMPRHGFPSLLRLVRNMNQGVHPSVRLIEHPAGGDRQPFRGESEALDIGHGDEPLADHGQLLGLEVVRVAARDDDVLELGPALDVSERLFPASAGWFERGLGYCVGVGTNCI